MPSHKGEVEDSGDGDDINVTSQAYQLDIIQQSSLFAETGKSEIYDSRYTESLQEQWRPAEVNGGTWQWQA